MSNYVKSRRTRFPRARNGAVKIFTDSACAGNGREEAVASVGVYFADGHPENVSKLISYRQTNIGAEIEAVLEAVSIVRKYQLDRVIIYTDSEFVVKGVNKWLPMWFSHGWRTPSGHDISYKIEFQTLATEMDHWDIEVKHVRGHFGIYGNKQANKLAEDALNSSDENTLNSDLVNNTIE